MLRSFRLLVVLLAFATPLSAGAGLWTRIGPYGGSIVSLAAAPTRPERIYAGCFQGGVFRSDDGGRSWSFAGAGLVDRVVDELAVHPRRAATVYAATSRGLFRTTDAGVSWRRLGVGSPLVGNRSFGALAIDALDPRVVYAASPEHPPIKSRDGGATWSALEGAPSLMLSLAIDPGRSGTVYAASPFEGPFKTTDGGRTWTRLARGLPVDLHPTLIAVDPRNPRRLLLAGGFSDGLFRSTDGGATWVRALGIGSSWVRALAFDAAARSIYADTWLAGVERVMRSTDGGVTWRLAFVPQGFSIWSLLAIPSRLLAGTSGQGIYASADRAISWQPSSQGLSALAISGLAVGDQSPPRLYAGDPSAGLFKSADRGEHWQQLNTDLGLESFRFFGPVEVDPLDPLTVWAGFFGGLGRSANGGRRWQGFPVLCLLPRQLVLDPGHPDTVYVGGGFSSVACGPRPNACISLKVTATETSCVEDPAGGPRGIPVLAADPHAAGHLLGVSLGNLYRSLDGGKTWALLAPAVAPYVVAFDPAQPGVLYGGFAGAVGRSVDGGATWELSGEGLPALPVHSLTLDPADSSVLYVPLPTAGVFKSVDAGSTWTEVGQGLEGLGPSRVVVDPEDPSILYVATGRASVLRLDQEP